MKKLDPVSQNTNHTNLPGIAPIMALANDSPGCLHGVNYLRFPVGAQKYHISGVRKAYDILTTVPPALNQSFFAFEGYSSRGVRAVPADSTAFPERHNDLHIPSFIVYEPAGKALGDEAAAYGEKMRDAIVEGNGTPLNAYVNYAYGTESQEELYGYEPWRQAKLKQLKEGYDPEGRFDFYNAILR
jgi:hypothetical protein